MTAAVPKLNVAGGAPYGLCSYLRNLSGALRVYYINYERLRVDNPIALARCALSMLGQADVAMSLGRS